MNQLKGTITNIEATPSIQLISIETHGESCSSLILENSSAKNPFQKGDAVTLLFKETEVSIAKNLSGQISLRNQLPCTIQEIETGNILSKILLDFKGASLTSIITSKSTKALALKKGDKVLSLLKTNELMLQKKINE